MAKKRTGLGAGQLPGSLKDFLEADPDRLSVSLLLVYLEEVEEQNRLLHKANDALQNIISTQMHSFERSLAHFKEEVERLKGVRLTEFRKAALEKQVMKNETKPYSRVHSRSNKGARRY